MIDISKEILGKLFAEENIQVFFRKVKTAYFDRVSRSLTIPEWTNIDPVLIDLMLLHETGHGLFTHGDLENDTQEIIDAVERRKNQRIKAFEDVLDDARIEKLMKRRFPNSKKTFFKGTKILLDEGFFHYKPEEFNSLGFVNRLNLYYKLGIYNHVQIQFSDSERKWIEKIDKLESYDDMIALSAEMAGAIEGEVFDKLKDEFNLQDLLDALPGAGLDGLDLSQLETLKDFEDLLSQLPDFDSGSDSSETPLESRQAEDSAEDSQGEGQQMSGDNEGEGEESEGDNDDFETKSSKPSSYNQTKLASEDENGLDDEINPDRVVSGPECTKGFGDKVGADMSGDVTNEKSLSAQEAKAELKNKLDAIKKKIDEATSTEVAKNLAEKFEEKATLDRWGRDSYRPEAPHIFNTHKIITFKEINAHFDTMRERANKKITEIKVKNDEYELAWLERTVSRIETIRNRSFNEKTIKKDIASAIQKFLMKKSADEMKRARTSKRGIINQKKLHKFKTSKDIFLSKTVVAEGKNHGIVIFIDWSGSMGNFIEETIKQMLYLVHFCIAVGVPFEVYAFSDRFTDVERTQYADKLFENMERNKKRCELVIQPFKLLNFFSSKMRKSEVKKMTENLAIWLEHRKGYSLELYGKGLYRYEMSMTPLNDCILAGLEILPNFKSEHGIDKLYSVYLTDGHSASTYFTQRNIRQDGTETFDEQNVSWNSDCFNYIIDKGRLHKFNKKTLEGFTSYERGNFEATTFLLQYLKEKTGCTTIGYRIMDKRSIKNSFNKFCKYNGDPRLVGKSDFFHFDDCGYDSFTLIKSENMQREYGGRYSHWDTSQDNDDDDLFSELKDDYGKNDVARVFKKHVKNKSAGFFIMNHFAELIA